MSDSHLKAIELLLDASGSCSDPGKYEAILALAKEMLEPHIRSGVPRAFWIKARLPGLGEDQPLSDEDLDTKWRTLIRESANGGCAEAQYRHGCNLYEEKQYVDALRYYQMAANQEYAPALWCLGIDMLYGTGVAKDEDKAIHLIRASCKTLRCN
jgi:TPR repeat protein